MEHIVIPDTDLIAINREKHENESGNIIYRDKNGKLHSIDFETCAINFKAEHKTSSGHCIGERKIDECYFVFYTSGIKTKIVFKKGFVANLFKHSPLSGQKNQRFTRLQRLIDETKYTTFDLS